MKTLLHIILFSSLSFTVAFAEPLIHGNGALEVFDEQGINNSPKWVRLWVMFMLSIFACSLFFVWRHAIARWVLGCFIAGMVALTLLTSVLHVPAYSGLIATIHLVFWSPALYLLLAKKPFINVKTPFSIWSGVMTFVILFSFVFDVRDAFIYLTHLV